MLISVSGKINSGKDLIGEIILYLTDKYYHSKAGEKASFENWKTSNIHSSGYNISHKAMYEANNTNHFKIKKFADKLKDIVCLLIGCTREQLEDETFKNTELGEEWWYFKGRNNTLIPYSKDSKRSDEDLVKLTPRLLLQLMGTNLFRNQLHPEIWVNSLMNEYKPLYGYQTTNSKITIGDISIPIPGLDIDKRVFPNWCITDMRFPNEMEAVKKRGGITIRVNRPCDICGGSGYHKMSCPVSKSGEHYSENALDKSEFDYVVDNDSDIQSLIEKIKQVLIKEKLL